MPLDEALQGAVNALEAKLGPLLDQLRPLQAEAARLQAAVNAICVAGGEPPKYSTDDATATAPEKPQARYGRGEFYGRPLLTVAKQVLSELGPQKRDELFAIMRDHGFDFGSRSEKEAMDGLAISLGKAHGITKLRNGCYVVVKEPRKKEAAPKQQVTESDATSDTENDG